MSRRPARRSGIPDRALRIRNSFEELRWRAAVHGCALSREQRLVLGAIYLLTPQDAPAEIFYDLQEVSDRLDQLDAAANSQDT